MRKVLAASCGRSLLRMIATNADKVVERRAILDTSGGHRTPEVIAQVDDRMHDGAIHAPLSCVTSTLAAAGKGRADPPKIRADCRDMVLITPRAQAPEEPHPPE